MFIMNEPLQIRTMYSILVTQIPLNQTMADELFSWAWKKLHDEGPFRQPFEQVNKNNANNLY